MSRVSQKDASWMAWSRAPQPATSKGLPLVCGVTASWQAPAPAAAPALLELLPAPGRAGGMLHAKGTAGRVAGSVLLWRQPCHHPCTGAPPQQVPGLISNRSAMTKFSSAAQAGLPAFPQQAALICSGMMRCPHEGTQNSSCCSSREKHKARSGPLRGHSAALGRICLLPRALGQCATTANKDPVLQRRELAAAPIQHLTSLTPLEGKGRSWLSVPSGTNLCVC